MTYIKPSKKTFSQYCFDRIEKLCQEYKSHHNHHSFKDQYFLFGKGGCVCIEIYPIEPDRVSGHILIEQRHTNKVTFSKTYIHHSGLLRGLDNYRIHQGVVG